MPGGESERYQSVLASPVGAGYARRRTGELLVGVSVTRRSGLCLRLSPDRPVGAGHAREKS